jgi:hypothetical protein
VDTSFFSLEIMLYVRNTVIEQELHTNFSLLDPDPDPKLIMSKAAVARAASTVYPLLCPPAYTKSSCMIDPTNSVMHAK